jgi:hypothetical protein
VKVAPASHARGPLERRDALPQVGEPAGARKAGSAPERERGEEIEVVLEDAVEDDARHLEHAAGDVCALDEETPLAKREARHDRVGDPRRREPVGELGDLGLVEADEGDPFHGCPKLITQGDAVDGASGWRTRLAGPASG